MYYLPDITTLLPWGRKSVDKTLRWTTKEAAWTNDRRICRRVTYAVASAAAAAAAAAADEAEAATQLDAA